LRHFLKDCLALVFVSQWMKKEAEKNLRYTHPASVVIPNPVDTDHFRPLKEPKKTRDSLKGVSIRSLTSSKYGLDVAIRAFRNVTDTSLTIIGTGTLDESYRNLIKQTCSNTLIIPEQINHGEMAKIMNQYDYFVAPSRLESQGVSMCEAMACGLPIVATKVGGIPEFVKDGQDGFLVDSDDPASLRSAVLKLVHHQNFKDFSSKVREHIVKLCGESSVIQRELELLNMAQGRVQH